MLIVNDTEIKGRKTIYRALDFLQLVGITTNELEAIMKDQTLVPVLIERLKADYPDLETDMDRMKDYIRSCKQSAGMATVKSKTKAKQNRKCYYENGLSFYLFQAYSVLMFTVSNGPDYSVTVVTPMMFCTYPLYPPASTQTNHKMLK